MFQGWGYPENSKKGDQKNFGNRAVSLLPVSITGMIAQYHRYFQKPFKKSVKKVRRSPLAPFLNAPMCFDAYLRNRLNVDNGFPNMVFKHIEYSKACLKRVSLPCKLVTPYDFYTGLTYNNGCRKINRSIDARGNHEFHITGVQETVLCRWVWI